MTGSVNGVRIKYFAFLTGVSNLLQVHYVACARGGEGVVLSPVSTAKACLCSLCPTDIVVYEVGVSPIRRDEYRGLEGVGVLERNAIGLLMLHYKESISEYLIGKGLRAEWLHFLPRDDDG